MGFEKRYEIKKTIGRCIDEIENDIQKEVIDGLFIYFDLRGGESQEDVNISVSLDADEVLLAIPLSKITDEAIDEAKKYLKDPYNSGISIIQLRCISECLKAQAEKIDKYLGGKKDHLG